MRQERRASETTKRTANDIFLEAKRRFQYKPGPSRKPHVHDIVGKSLKSETKDSRQRSLELKSHHLYTQTKKSRDKTNKQNKPKIAEVAAEADVLKVKQMMKDIIQENQSKDESLVFDSSEKISLVLDQDSSKELEEEEVRASGGNDNHSKHEEEVLKFQVKKGKPLAEINHYHQPRLFPKRRETKSNRESRNVSIQLKRPVNNRQFLSKKQNQMKQTIPLKPKQNIQQQPLIDHHRHLSSIEILEVSEPPAQQPSESPLSFNFTDLDIQIQSIKEPPPSCQKQIINYQSKPKSRRYKYDTEQQNKSQSIMCLSPVKGYSFDREQRLLDLDDKKRKLSVELKKGVKQTIIEEQEDKSSHSRILDLKCNQIFQVLDTKHIGIINYRNYQNPSVHPQILALIQPIISKVLNESKSFNKKQFVFEIKRIMASMKEKQVDTIAKCPMFKPKNKQVKSASKSIKTDLTCDKTLPLKQITRAPYMRLNTRNSIGEIELSKLSAQDSLQVSSQSIAQPNYHPQFISDRKKEDQKVVQKYHPLYSLRRSLESQLDASRIDALNERLSSYIQRNNIQQNRYMSNQINLEFHELKKHLGFS